MRATRRSPRCARCSATSSGTTGRATCGASRRSARSRRSRPSASPHGSSTACRGALAHGGPHTLAGAAGARALPRRRRACRCRSRRRAYSRRRERAADAFGFEVAGDPEAFARALEGLCRDEPRGVLAAAARAGAGLASRAGRADRPGTRGRPATSEVAPTSPVKESPRESTNSRIVTPVAAPPMSSSSGHPAGPPPALRTERSCHGTRDRTREPEGRGRQDDQHRQPRGSADRAGRAGPRRRPRSAVEPDDVAGVRSRAARADDLRRAGAQGADRGDRAARASSTSPSPRSTSRGPSWPCPR